MYLDTYELSAVLCEEGGGRSMRCWTVTTVDRREFLQQCGTWLWQRAHQCLGLSKQREKQCQGEKGSHGSGFRSVKVSAVDQGIVTKRTGLTAASICGMDHGLDQNEQSLPKRRLVHWA
jgi:hypothetical protein